MKLGIQSLYFGTYFGPKLAKKNTIKMAENPAQIDNDVDFDSIDNAKLVDERRETLNSIPNRI